MAFLSRASGVSFYFSAVGSSACRAFLVWDPAILHVLQVRSSVSWWKHLHNRYRYEFELAHDNMKARLQLGRTQCNRKTAPFGIFGHRVLLLL